MANITPSLSLEYECHLGDYLFEQAVDNEVMFAVHYDRLFAYVYGGEEPYHTIYYRALVDGRMLKRTVQQLRAEDEDGSSKQSSRHFR